MALIEQTVSYPKGPALVYVHTDDDTLTQPDLADPTMMPPRERAIARALLRLALDNLAEPATGADGV